MSGCGEGAEWVEQLRAPRQGYCTSQSQPVKATLLRRAVTLCATVARWLRRQNGLIWYYLVRDNLFVSGLDWGTIILTAYVDTEYQIEVDGSQRSIFLKTNDVVLDKSFIEPENIRNLSVF